MKILFLTPWYPDERRKNHGVFVRDQASALSTEHEVVVISSKINYEQFAFRHFEIKESKFGKVKEHRIVVKRSLPIYNQINYFLISTKIANRIAREFKPDIIHGNIGYPGGFWSWLVSRRVKVPFVITEHTFIYNNFRSWIHKYVTLFAMRRASALITVSSRAAMEIGKYCDANVDVVANVVDASKYTISPFVSGTPVIGFLGGLTSPKHVKGLDTLLRALSNVNFDFTLLVGGSGGQLQFYKSLAERLGLAECCQFLGYIDAEDVPIFMNRLNVFVNSSRFESFGIAIVEAMASGVPVVCFNNGGPADFVNEKNGILVEDQNEHALAIAIEEMLRTYGKYDRFEIKDGARQFAGENFVANTTRIYKRVLLSLR